MINELNYLGVPAWIAFILISIAVLSYLFSALKNIWGFIAPKLFGIQTKMEKKREIETAVLKNQKDIQILKERQDKDHDCSIEEDSKIREEIADMKKSIDCLGSSVLQMRIDNMRSVILDFASAVGDGRTYSKEQYDVVILLYKEYEELLNEHNMTNGLVDISIEIIEAQYKWNMTHHGFLEDKIQKNESSGYYEKKKV